MRIRPVAARDVHAIAQLQMRAWRHEHDGWVDEDHMPDLEDRIALWNGVRPGEAWLAQEPDGRIVGVVGVHDGEVGVLHIDPDLLDDPSYDVDGALLRHAEDVMRSSGHTSALLWTFRENQHNRALYAKHGWLPDGTEQETLPGVVEVRYRREL
ncbi:MAG TPA: GNAT family N-acetyltransferase [Baekduia sp.]